MQKVLLVLFLFAIGTSMYVHKVNANEGVSHLWNEFYSVGLNGAYSEDTLVAGINGFYNTHLEHRRSGGVTAHFNNLGILGIGNYDFNTNEIIGAVFITSGYYLSKDTLLQWGVGPAYSESFGTGISAIGHIGYAYQPDYTFSLFVQSDYFRERDSTQFMLGVSLGFGSLKSYQ